MNCQPRTLTPCNRRDSNSDGGAIPYRYIVTADGLSEALSDIRQPGPIALDIETYFPDAKLTKKGKRMKVATDTVCDRFKSKIRLLQLYCDGSDTVWLIDIRALESANADFGALRETLAEKEIVGHNVTCFDLLWLWHHLRVRVSQIRDTLTAHHLLYGGTDERGDLGTVLQRMLGLDLPKTEGASDWGVDDLTAQQLAYAADDVFHLHELLRAQESAIGEAKLEKAWKLEKRLAPIVVDMRIAVSRSTSPDSTHRKRGWSSD